MQVWERSSAKAVEYEVNKTLPTPASSSYGHGKKFSSFNWKCHTGA